MKWILKSISYKILSIPILDNRLYPFVQRRLTKSVVPTNERIAQKIQVGLQYLDAVESLGGSVDLGRMVHVEIGAGWMPTIPFLLYSLGIDRQILCDIRKNIKLDTVDGVTRVFNEIAEKETSSRGIRIQRGVPLVEPGEDLDRYLSRLGIRYAAPYTRDDLLDDGAPKLITCTQVLLHLRKEQLGRLFEMIASVLSRSGGVFLATVHLYDLYSDFDSSLSRYNKWRYSDFIWERIINSKLMSFNRLTARDYRILLEQSGLNPIEFHVTWPSHSDLEELKKVPIHRDFASVPREELAAKHLFFIARV